MRGCIVAIATVAACLAASSSANADNLLSNGGFESYDMPTGTWATYASIPGWQATNNCGLELQDHVAGNPYQGGQFVELNSRCKSGIRYVYPVCVSRNIGYTLKYAFSPRPGTAADANAVNVLVNGRVMDSFGPAAGGSSTQWTVHKRSFVPSDNMCFELSFVSAGADYRYDHTDAELSSGNNSVGGYVDAVSLTYSDLAMPTSLPGINICPC